MTAGAAGRAITRQVASRTTGAARAFGRWAWGTARHTRKQQWTRRVRVAAWSLTGASVYSLTAAGGAPDAAEWGLGIAASGMLPGLGRAGFAFVAPWTYARFDAWTFRRSLARFVKEQWPAVAMSCGLSVRSPGSDPIVTKIRTKGEPGSVLMTVPVLAGQTVKTVLHAADAVATAYRAHAFEVRPAGPGVVTLRLFMINGVQTARTAALPSVVTVDAVRAGIRLDGAPFDLQVRGRHTLVVGASGAGKGSAFWAIVGGLAPAVPAGLVRLWGVDLKKGLEAGMGEALFHATAYGHADALAILRALIEVIEVRGAAMRGVVRSFDPTPGDPVHVLVIDELADLMAYADIDTRREAERLLSVILTQGRALGVVVAAFVQNPRQDAVGMRNLYTQKIALRLDAEVETDMVLGSLADTAPAHLIDRNTPGVGFLVNEDGTCSMVRFDYWPDDLIRATAATYPAPDRITLTAAPAGPGVDELRARLAPAVDVPAEDGPAPVRKRAPRKPRAPRAPRPVVTDEVAPAEGAA